MILKKNIDRSLLHPIYKEPILLIFKHVYNMFNRHRSDLVFYAKKPIFLSLFIHFYLFPRSVVVKQS